MSAEQFALWKRHPVTELVFSRFLPEWGEALKEETLGVLLIGKLDMEAALERRGRLLIVREMCALSLDGVRNFYGFVPEPLRPDRSA